jgi:hypothetical protein
MPDRDKALQRLSSHAPGGRVLRLEAILLLQLLQLFHQPVEGFVGNFGPGFDVIKPLVAAHFFPQLFHLSNNFRCGFHGSLFSSVQHQDFDLRIIDSDYSWFPSPFLSRQR